MCDRIDTVADTVRQRFVVSSMRAWEYKQAEIDATEFKANGYTGTVPISVDTWVEATGMTPQQAADDIIKTAENFTYALGAIRKARLVGKAKIAQAATEVEGQVLFDLYIDQLKQVQLLAS